MDAFHTFSQQQSNEGYDLSKKGPLKRTRAKRSCDFCRKRKSRCDADVSTPCSNCRAWGYNCEFQTVRKKRGPPSAYVDNLEKKCKKMETLLIALTQCSIKELEKNGFQYDGHAIPSPLNDTESSSEDEDERDFDPVQPRDYDSIKYVGQSSAGLKLFDQNIFKSQSAIPWPGRKDVMLKMMSQDEVMFVSTEKSTQGRSDTLLDVGLCMRGPSSRTPISMIKTPAYNKKPAKHQLDKIIGLYFTHMHCILPVVHKKKFLEQYHNMSSNDSPFLLMQAVLALTFRFASQRLPDLVKDASEFGDMYFRKVMKRLRDSDRSRLCYVQASLLMVLYLDMDEGDVESMQWCTAGSAIRMAQDLGLHRSCVNWNLPRSEIEIRHRVFYSCYVIDRCLSARAGKPLTILDRDFDTDLPSPYEIEDEDGSDPPGQPIYRSFILMIKLCEILGRILKALYAPNAKIANSNAGLDDPTILAVFERRLKNWRSSLDEPFDGVYLADIDKHNLQVYHHTVFILLHRPFTQLCTKKYPGLKSIVDASVKACTDAADMLYGTLQQREGRDWTPSYYHLYCAPGYFVYALFQASLVYLSNALRDKSGSNIRAYKRSIELIQSIAGKGLAPRAAEILNMLGSINGLFDQDGEPVEGDLQPIASPLSVSNQPAVQPIQEPVVQIPKAQYVHHRMINTSIVGGLTPDIQSDIGIIMDRPCSSQEQQQQHYQEQQKEHYQNQEQQEHYQHSINYTEPQQHTANYSQNYRPHSTGHFTHHRSISLDQLNSITSQHVISSHSRSISHDHFDFTMPHHYGVPPSSNYQPTTYTLPQAPQAYTATYDSNVHVSNTTLPPSSLNWSDWDVYIGHQQQQPQNNPYHAT